MITIRIKITIKILYGKSVKYFSHISPVPNPMNGLIFPVPLPYAPVAELQELLVAARIAGTIPDTILLVEHKPVITLGVRGKESNILQSRDVLHARGIAVEHTVRGGDVTYHAPGQLVLYPIINLDDARLDVHGYISALEEIVISTAKQFGVDTFRRKGMTGVWTSQGKLAAIGVRFKHRVAYHGVSLNITVDLRGFETIVPCGLAGEPVVSLQSLLGDCCPRFEEVRQIMVREFGRIFDRAIVLFKNPKEFPPTYRTLITPAKITEENLP
jgi:lipoate-protein ligase B